MPPISLAWNKTFTAEDAYSGDTAFDYMRMIRDAFHERARACGPFGLFQGRPNMIPFATRELLMTVGDNNALMTGSYDTHQFYDQYDPLAADIFLTPTSNDFYNRFDWLLLQVHVDILRRAFLDPAYPDPPFRGAHKRLAAPPGSFTRKYPREIHRLDRPGSAGQVARFVVWKFQVEGSALADDWGNLTINPVPVTTPTPDDQRQHAGKLFRHDGSAWVEITDGSASKPDVVDTKKGYMRGGDFYGPWVMNEIRDALNSMDTNCSSLFNPNGGVPVSNNIVDVSVTGNYPTIPGCIGTANWERGFNARVNGIWREIDVYILTAPISPPTALFDSIELVTTISTDQGIHPSALPPLPDGTGGVVGGYFIVVRWNVPGGFRYTKDT